MSDTISVNKEELRMIVRECVQKKFAAVAEEKKASTIGKKNFLKEKAEKLALLESKDSGVGAYAQKVDELVEEMISKLDKLAEEGVAITQDNPTHDYAIQERNHLVMARVGILKGIKSKLVSVIEDLYRNV